MMNHAEPGSDPSCDESPGNPAKTSLTLRDSIHSNFNQAENKTRTSDCTVLNSQDLTSGDDSADLHIERVWREVIDFGEPGSGNGEDGWGRKRVSVARVSILDGPLAGRQPTDD